MFGQKTLKIICCGLLIAFPLQAFAQVTITELENTLPPPSTTATGTQSIDPDFNPSYLIDDSTFSDIGTFGGAAGIQKFLEIKNSVLASTSPDFLIKLKEPTISLLKQGLDDPEPNLDHLRTAAQLIWDASQSSGLNPQVILVTMEKEQGLVDGTFDNDIDLQTALDHAMGFACPDSGGCGNLFPGFYYQLFGNFDSSGNRYLGSVKSLMKSFSTPGGRGPDINGSAATVGQTVDIQNTLGGYVNIAGDQLVDLSNNATAALYRYTPHVFNGNYNFWKFFQSWFRYQNGTLVALSDAPSAIYIIEDGSKQLVPQFVAQARNLSMTSITTVSPTEFSSYPTYAVYSPSDNTIIKTPGGQTYVFINGVKHPASSFVITQRGLNIATALGVDEADADLFPASTVLPPNDGTIIKGTTTAAVYIVKNGEIEMFSSYTFSQNKVKASSIVTVPDAEIATYTQNGFVPPQDGSLVKASDSSTVYLVQNGLKEPVLADVFKNQGYSNSQVASISDNEVNSLPVGTYAEPKDKTFFSADTSTGQLYEFKSGTTHAISTYVAKQRGITPDYVFSSQVISNWSSGIPVPPRDGTLVKGDGSGTVYLTENGQLDPLTAAAFKNHHYRTKSIVVLPQAEVNSYAQGNTIAS